MKLRDYQEIAAEKALMFFFDHNRKKNEIIVLPTGSGKSLVISAVAHLLDSPVIIFQPSKEILEQNYQKLIDIGVFDVSIFSASMNKKKVSRITLATIGSAINQPSLFRHFKYMIIDECDLVNSYGKNMYKRFFEMVPGKILGLTATPFRMASSRFSTEYRFITRMTPRVFGDICHYEQISTMCEQGYWAKLKYFHLDGFYQSKITLNSSGADFSDDGLKKYYEEIKFSDQLVAVVDKLYKGPRRNILVFTKFVDEARAITQLFPGTSEVVSGETPKKEREEILQRFRSGQIRMVANVGVLTTGFDFPELETIIIARPTRSLRLYYQIVGRAVRPHHMKKEAYIIDMCENFKRFGAVEDLQISHDESGKWCIKSRGMQLTNVSIPNDSPNIFTRKEKV